jgi:hypothetical protein
VTNKFLISFFFIKFLNPKRKIRDEEIISDLKQKEEEEAIN